MKFLVHFTRREDQYFNDEAMTHQQNIMADLIHEKVLNQVFMNKDQSQIWLEMFMEDRFALDLIIKTLPLCNELTYDVHELA